MSDDELILLEDLEEEDYEHPTESPPPRRKKVPTRCLVLTLRALLTAS